VHLVGQPVGRLGPSRGDDPAAWWRLVLYGALALAVAVLAGIDLSRGRGRRRLQPQ
jgi:hypothetical protein